MVQVASREVVTSHNDSGETVTKRKRQSTAPVPEEHPQQAYRTKKTILRSYQTIWYILGFIQVLLAFRFILRMLGANAASGFGNLIYSLSYPFAAPFFGLFGTSREGVYVIEWTTLVAMAVYTLVAYGLVHLFQLIKPTTPEEVEGTVDTV
jgi:hypothetical protein